MDAKVFPDGVQIKSATLHTYGGSKQRIVYNQSIPFALRSVSPPEPNSNNSAYVVILAQQGVVHFLRLSILEGRGG
ncbi:hypothetical protein PR048_026208 [Dryococelus australis]|uniref:Uncharacterized protein n=1 Tax=Dryococelus australis TaxID=614101 RepID=A0ABQ9GKS6_9NEOP|nr:hypothetical protein PR048_026208 [Dryococelus australis]